MQSDCKTTNLTASGAIFGGPARVKGIYYVASATAGSIVIKNGGSGGTTEMTIATPALATATQYVDLCGCPLYCDVDAYAALTNVTSATFVYS